MNTVKCKCGNFVPVTYPTLVVARSNADYYEWTCGKCGQQYMELIKDPIVINEDEQ